MPTSVALRILEVFLDRDVTSFDDGVEVRRDRRVGADEMLFHQRNAVGFREISRRYCLAAPWNSFDS